MANRTKRNARLEREAEREMLFQTLLKESDAVRKEQRQSREKDRKETRKNLRLIRRGIPEWVLNNEGMLSFFHTVRRYRHRWLRTPYPWPWKEVQHLRDLEILFPELMFVKYPLPAVMKNVWLEEDDKLKQWYIHMAQGQNIRTAPGLPFRLTKRMAYLFLKTPDHIKSVYQALRYAQVLGLGGNPELAELIRKSQMDFEPDRAAFWETVIQWMVKNQPFTEEMVESLIHYITIRKYTETMYNWREGGLMADSAFCLKGKKKEFVFFRVNLFNDECFLYPDDFECNAIIQSVNEFVHATGGEGKPRVVYRIKPLLTPESLIKEGRAMSHCVASYCVRVWIGKTSIWSLTKQIDEKRPRRMVTIALDESRCISEALGKHNQFPSGSANILIRQWAIQENLKWTPKGP